MAYLACVSDSCTCINNQQTHLPKKRPRCYAKLPTAQDTCMQACWWSVHFTCKHWPGPTTRIMLAPALGRTHLCQMYIFNRLLICTHVSYISFQVMLLHSSLQLPPPVLVIPSPSDVLLLGTWVGTPPGEWVEAVSVLCYNILFYLWTKWWPHSNFWNWVWCATFFSSTLNGTATPTLNGTLVECFGPANNIDPGDRVGSSTIQILGQWSSICRILCDTIVHGILEVVMHCWYSLARASKMREPLSKVLTDRENLLVDWVLTEWCETEAFNAAFAVL